MSILVLRIRWRVEGPGGIIIVVVVIAFVDVHIFIGSVPIILIHLAELWHPQF
jgi:hypothetical protein